MCIKSCKQTPSLFCQNTFLCDIWVLDLHHPNAREDISLHRWGGAKQKIFSGAIPERDTKKNATNWY